jgi:hypothetical protein
MVFKATKNNQDCAIKIPFKTSLVKEIAFIK